MAANEMGWVTQDPVMGNTKQIRDGIAAVGEPCNQALAMQPGGAISGSKTNKNPKVHRVTTTANQKKFKQKYKDKLNRQ